jgi:hypothetical protein
MLEAWSEVDAKLVDISGDPAGTRESEAVAFLESMNNEMATGMFYHNTESDPEKFMGLAPRFDSLSATNGNQIIDAGGTGSDNCSIWFVVWGERTCHLLYSKGSTAGFSRTDKGKETKDDSGALYDVYREKFTWDIGLSVRDWRYVSRVCNIDVSNLTVDASSSSANIPQQMIKAYYKLHQRKVTGGRAAIYCNSTVKEYLHHHAMNANSNTQIRLQEYDGEEVLSFLGMPIREVDALTNTEARVT